jgi:hypothetical protein
LPTWERVHQEIAEASAGIAPGAIPSGYDIVRRQKLAALGEYLGFPVIVYAVDCLSASPKTVALQQILGPAASMLEVGDKDAFSEVLEELEGDEVGVMLQSPGGFAETAEAVVQLLRAKFQRVTFIVPAYAKSAATMLALSGDTLLLDEHSELGPIDPQFTFPNGVVSPAKSILNQFESAVAEIQEDGTKLPAWAPILQRYAPSLLQDAREALDLAERMVAKWLEQYMFQRREDRAEKALAVARYFSDRDPGAEHRSHGRPIGIDKALEQELNVSDARVNPGLQQRVRELHHAVNITFEETNAYKMAENAQGNALIRAVNVQFSAVQPPPGAQQPEQAGEAPATS